MLPWWIRNEYIFRFSFWKKGNLGWGYQKRIKDGRKKARCISCFNGWPPRAWIHSWHSLSNESSRKFYVSRGRYNSDSSAHRRPAGEENFAGYRGSRTQSISSLVDGSGLGDADRSAQALCPYHRRWMLRADFLPYPDKINARKITIDYPFSCVLSESSCRMVWLLGIFGFIATPILFGTTMEAISGRNSHVSVKGNFARAVLNTRSCHHVRIFRQCWKVL